MVKRRTLVLLLSVAALPLYLGAQAVGPLLSFSNGGVANADHVNANFDALRTAVNTLDTQVSQTGTVAGQIGGLCEQHWMGSRKDVSCLLHRKGATV